MLGGGLWVFITLYKSEDIAAEDTAKWGVDDSDQPQDISVLTLLFNGLATYAGKSK